MEEGWRDGTVEGWRDGGILWDGVRGSRLKMSQPSDNSMIRMEDVYRTSTMTDGGQSYTVRSQRLVYSIVQSIGCWLIDHN